MFTEADSHTTDGMQTRFEPDDVQADAIKAFLTAADALARAGEMTQAELRFRQALRQSELSFGTASSHTAQVLIKMSAFYRGDGRESDAQELERRILTMELVSEQNNAPSGNLLGHFGRKKRTTLTNMPRFMPPEVRKSCQILGINPDEPVTDEVLNKAWKREIVAGSIHPDLGGAEEASVQVNTAKDIVQKWLNDQAPKLGKLFGTVDKI